MALGSRAPSQEGKAQPSTQMGSHPARTGRGTPVRGSRRASAHSIFQVGSLGQVTVTSLGLHFHTVKWGDKISPAQLQGLYPSSIVWKTALQCTQVGSVIIHGFTRPQPLNTYRVPTTATVTNTVGTMCQPLSLSKHCVHHFIHITWFNHHHDPERYLLLLPFST